MNVAHTCVSGVFHISSSVVVSRHGLSRRGLSRRGLSRHGLSRHGLSRRGPSLWSHFDWKLWKFEKIGSFGSKANYLEDRPIELEFTDRISSFLVDTILLRLPTTY